MTHLFVFHCFSCIFVLVLSVAHKMQLILVKLPDARPKKHTFKLMNKAINNCTESNRFVEEKWLNISMLKHPIFSFSSSLSSSVSILRFLAMSRLCPVWFESKHFFSFFILFLSFTFCFLISFVQVIQM